MSRDLRRAELSRSLELATHIKRMLTEAQALQEIAVSNAGKLLLGAAKARIAKDQMAWKKAAIANDASTAVSYITECITRMRATDAFANAFLPLGWGAVTDDTIALASTAAAAFGHPPLPISTKSGVEYTPVSAERILTWISSAAKGTQQDLDLIKRATELIQFRASVEASDVGVAAAAVTEESGASGALLAEANDCGPPISFSVDNGGGGGGGADPVEGSSGTNGHGLAGVGNNTPTEGDML